MCVFHPIYDDNAFSFFEEVVIFVLSFISVWQREILITQQQVSFSISPKEARTHFPGYKSPRIRIGIRNKQKVPHTHIYSSIQTMNDHGRCNI